MSVTEQIQRAVSELPPTQQQRVLEFVQALHNDLAEEDKAIGEAALKLIPKILEPEDFSDWGKTSRG
jgi:hypothetical protein